MSTGIDLDSYLRRLVTGLRAHDVPGHRIAQAVAEVESHVADTGEDPIDAFGEPEAYAAALSRSLDVRRPRFLRGRARWAGPLLGVASFAAGALSFGWIRDSLRRDDGTELAWSAAGGAALMAVVILLGMLLHRRLRLIDPRTGADLRVLAPRRVAVAVGCVILGGAILAMVSPPWSWV